MINFSIIQKSQLEGATRIDAEYYQLEYLDLIKKIKNSKLGSQSLGNIKCKIVSGPFGSSLKSEAYLNDGVPFVRISDLDNFFINKSGLVYISKKDNDRLRQSQLCPNDLILSKVGNTIGLVSIVPKEIKICNISENNIGIKFTDNDLTEEFKRFILTFLNSKIGYSQIYRKISGNAQPKLNVCDVNDLSFPIPEGQILKKINDLIIQSEDNIKISELFYQQAENLLLEELGLKGFGNEEKLSSIVNFSEIESVCRIDAEYFQPKYNIILEKTRKNNGKKLGDLVSMKKGIEVGAQEYQDEGKVFIRVSSMTKFGIVESDQKCLSDKLYESLKKDFEPKKGEILLTKDATLGIAYVLKEDIQSIISGGTLRLKIKDDSVEGEYLALCLNSIIGQMQAERDAGGSVIAHWKPEQIKNVIIPVLPKEIQLKISELIQKSHEARKKSKELLEEAKRKVEDMIESA